MNPSEIKKLMIGTLNSDADSKEVAETLEGMGISYNFSKDFNDRVLRMIAVPVLKITRQMEFVKYMNMAFYRIALTGVAAIIFLLISIFLTEGSLSFNSFLGLNNSYDESIVCLLTGN